MTERKQKRYFRLTRSEQASVERELGKRRPSARGVARDLGRSPASISDEVRRNRTVAKGPGRGERAADVPEDACARLLAWPWTCNGCQHRRHGCRRALRCEYSAARAQALADGLLSEARKGVNKKEYDFERAMAEIRADVARGLSPAQIAEGRACEFKAHPSTIYRWIAAGYAGMSNAELRRKVGYKPRKGRAEAKPTSHGPERSYKAFSALPEEKRAHAAEMDTVIGLSKDSACVLTLYARPCKVQVCLLLAEKSSSAVAAALDMLEKAIGKPLFQRLFGLVLTDNGTEFSDTEALERSVPRDGPDQSVLLRRAGVPAEGRMREKPRGAAQALAEGPGHLVRRSEGARHGRRHEPAQLRAEALAHEHAAHRDAQGSGPGGRGSPHGRARHRGDPLRKAEP